MIGRCNGILLVALFVFAGSDALASQPLTLGSGRSVEVLAVGPLQSTHGWTGLMLKYRTEIPLNDVARLRQEVDEIWERLVVDAERANYTNAVISANDAETGFIVTKNNSYNFVFKKSDGSWRTLESNERAQSKLDRDFIEEFVRRLDWALEHNNVNAALLYLANDWTITISNPRDAKSPPQTLDRMRFAAVTHATFAAASNHQHTREIIDVSIGADGTHAQVTSRETEEMTIKDRHVSGVERSVDSFELRGDIMLWTKSISVIEGQTEAN
jgi:hypothetical protein